MRLTKYSGSRPTRWNQLMDSFFDDQSFFTSESNLNIPATNIIDEDNAFKITMAVPGLSKEDFNIAVDNGLLTVSSEKRKSAETKEDNFTRREYSFNSFSRSFTLPQNVKDTDIVAEYENGELVLTVPKKEISASTAKTIEIS